MKKTATEGVFISDEDESICQKMWRDVLQVVYNSTDDNRLRMEGLMMAVAAFGMINEIDKELILRGIKKIYDVGLKKVVLN